MCSLTQQEQALAQTHGGLPPLPPGGGVRAGGGGGGGGGGGEGGGGVEGHPVDILQMLANARNEYDKVGTSADASQRILYVLLQLFLSPGPSWTNGPAKWSDVTP